MGRFHTTLQGPGWSWDTVVETQGEFLSPAGWLTRPGWISQQTTASVPELRAVNIYSFPKQWLHKGVPDLVLFLGGSLPSDKSKTWTGSTLGFSLLSIFGVLSFQQQKESRASGVGGFHGPCLDVVFVRLICDPWARSQPYASCDGNKAWKIC